MTYTLSAAERARESRRDQHRYYAKSRADAKRADDWYRLAAQNERIARSLTTCSGRWDPETGYTPWQIESMAATCSRVGDTYLRSSFWNFDQARFYGRLAARQTATARKFEEA